MAHDAVSGTTAEVKDIQSSSFFLMDQCPVFDLQVSCPEVDPSELYGLSHLAASVLNPLSVEH